VRKGSVVYLAVKGGWGMPSAWRLGANITSLNQRTALSMWFLRRDEQDRIVSGRGIVRGPCSAVAVDRVLALGRDGLRPHLAELTSPPLGTFGRDKRAEANGGTAAAAKAIAPTGLDQLYSPRHRVNRGWIHRLPKVQQRRWVMKVKDVMHKGVDWVSPDTPVTELAKLMREHDIGAIPIGENDRLIGMVTDRDIVCKGLAEDSFDASKATAHDVMTPGIHCCRDDDDLAKAVRHMEQLQVRRLPVINKSKRMVGILSLGDLSRSASGDLLSEWVKSVSAHH
jgi:CBS domain-containing protein